MPPWMLRLQFKASFGLHVQKLTLHLYPILGPILIRYLQYTNVDKTWSECRAQFLYVI